MNRAVLIQYGLAILASLSSLIAGAWLSWPSKANGMLERGEVCCEASSSQISTMVALMDLGNVLTPVPASYLSDHFGRAPVLHSTAVLFLLAALLAMFANHIAYLYLARLAAGMGKGVVFGVLPHLLAEIAELPIRGSLGTVFTATVSFGMTYDYFFGAFFTYQQLNIANLAVPVAFGIAYFFIPESPYFLVMKGKEKQALKSLETYRQVPRTDPSILAEMELIRETVDQDMRNKASFLDVVKTKSRRRALMISSLTALFQRLAGISPLLAYSTITLPAEGGGLSVEIYAIIFSLLIVAGNYIGISMVDTVGRKILFIFSTACCAVIDLIFAIFFTLKSSQVDVSSYLWVPYATLLLFGFFWGVGMSYIPSILVSELFPTNIKSYASSIQSMTFALASFAANKLFGEISASYGPEVMFYAFSVFCVICTLFSVLFIFETKGKTFQEIQQTLCQVTKDDEEAELNDLSKVRS